MNWQAFGALVAVISLACTLLLWAIKILLTRHSAAIAERFEELQKADKHHNSAIGRIERELADHKLESAKIYLHRDDAVIFFGRCEQKIDAIWSFLHERFARGSE